MSDDPFHHFDGSTYDHDRDGKRLNVQHRKVLQLMSDGEPRTLVEIEQSLGFPMQSISARLRDLRKPRFGAHTVIRRHLGDGLFDYRLILNFEQAVAG